MPVLAAPALNWQGSPEPQSGTALVDPDSIIPFIINLGVLAAPFSGQPAASVVAATTVIPVPVFQGTAIPAPDMGAGGGGVRSVGYAS